MCAATYTSFRPCISSPPTTRQPAADMVIANNTSPKLTGDESLCDVQKQKNKTDETKRNETKRKRCQIQSTMAKSVRRSNRLWIGVAAGAQNLLQDATDRVQMQRCQLHKSSNGQSANAQMLKCSKALNAQLLNCSKATKTLNSCTNAHAQNKIQMSERSNAHILKWTHQCTNAHAQKTRNVRAFKCSHIETDPSINAD